jgi:hypothetical protein
MKVMLFISAFILLVVFLAFFPMINNVLETTSGVPEPMIPIIQIGFCIFPVSLIGFTFFSSWGSDEETSTDDEEDFEEEEPLEEMKKAHKSAYQILAERFAKGEISDEEYTERMARL